MPHQTISPLIELPETHLQQLCQLEKQLFGISGWDAQSLETMFAQKYNHFFISMIDDKVVAYCIVQVMFETAEILRIGVDKAHQGQGVAKQVLAAVVKFLQTAKADKLLLEVRDDNVAAVGLYQRLDFKQIHVRKNYYDNKNGTFTDGLILQKELG